MSNAASQLSPWKTGPDPVTPTAGVDGLVFLVPVAEPISVGSAPVRPLLVERMSPGLPTARKVPVRGWMVTSSMETAGRVRYSVRWEMSKAERDSFIDWVRNTLRGTLLAWELEPDGEDNGTVKVRCLTDVPDVYLVKNVWVAEVEVEEVF